MTKKLLRGRRGVSQLVQLGAPLVALKSGVARAGVRWSMGSFLSVFLTRHGNTACSAECAALGQTLVISSGNGTCK